MRALSWTALLLCVLPAVALAPPPPGALQVLTPKQADNRTASLVALAPDGGTVAACDSECNVTLWSIARGEPLWSRRPTRERPWSLAYSPAGNRLLLVTQERNV